MIALEEAQARLLALATPLPAESVPLGNALGRWVSTPVVALRTQPARDLSAMDGYALRFGDLPGPLTVIGESAAGRAFGGAIGALEAVRIFTGAVVPHGADCILIQEEAMRAGDMLTCEGPGPAGPGAHIRRVGSDFSEGDVLIEAGAVVTPARIALAAMGGHANLPVRRPARIALISTGDELRLPGVATLADQIPSSNGPMIAAMLTGGSAEIQDCGIIPDRIEPLIACFADLKDCDVIVTLGGASVGDHDLVKPALEAAGATFDFWKVAMRPGKPVMAGRLGGAVVLGLPGNPVSAFVTALLFLKPLIAHLGGAADPGVPRVNTRLGAALPANGPRLDHVRARLEGGTAMPTGRNDSAALAALAASDALIVRPAHALPAEIGDFVEVIPTG